MWLHLRVRILVCVLLASSCVSAHVYDAKNYHHEEVEEHLKKASDGKEKAKQVWTEELKPGHDEATTKLKRQRDEIEAEKNFKIKGSILYNCLGIIEDGWAFGFFGIWPSISSILDGLHAFYLKGNILEELENSEKVLRKYDTIRLRMDTYLSPLGVNTFPSLKLYIKDIQNMISHIESSRSWKSLTKIVLGNSFNLYKSFFGDKEKDDSFVEGAPIAYRLINLGYDIYDLTDGIMCDEANVLEKIIMEIQSEYDNLERVLFER